jgi:hypothetical protein
LTNSNGLKLFLIILLLICFQTTSLAEEWKGIVPGVATRSDVVRLIQNCEDRTVPCEFDLESDKIRIVFSGMVQDYFYQCARSLPADTVLVVEVTPNKRIGLKNLRRNHNLRRLGTTFKFGAWVDERAGLVLKSFNNYVIQLNYIADASSSIRCRDYYNDPIKFATVVTHCPPVTILGPGAVTAGDTANFQADVKPDPKMTLMWTLSGGRVVSQTGRQISLDTTGLGGQSITTTVQARGSCSVENSATLNVRP